MRHDSSLNCTKTTSALGVTQSSVVFCLFVLPLFKGAPTILVIRLIYVFSSGSLRDEIIADKSVTNKSLGGRKTNKNRRKTKEEERDVVIERGTTESNGMGRLLLLSYA